MDAGSCSFLTTFAKVSKVTVQRSAVARVPELEEAWCTPMQVRAMNLCSWLLIRPSAEHVPQQNLVIVSKRLLLPSMRNPGMMHMYNMQQN